MNEAGYKEFYDKVGALNGWDFSRIKCRSEGVSWNFYAEVTKRCRSTDVLLDIGTGGGEALLSIADAARLLIGIDQSDGMIGTAADNLSKSLRENVRFVRMEAEKLEFPDRFFNIISCRHSPFNAKETARVLADDGVFLTQQVSEGDKANIKRAFGRGQGGGIPSGTLRNRLIQELSEAGFTDIQSFEYNAAEYYRSYEDLIFLLKHTPTIPGFGEDEADLQRLAAFIEGNQSEKGIETNSERFMIIARK
ncbi:class I SAM-dependent methyltransferase [Paenibacillus sp. sptzw28]|uniref:class I SAM-dependent methyltransferase n=1 Tax=Paenibacillus sp. sptzw28 TaxID=715179 RepID=UPI001C6E3029|nr:class I SAM-dependent methyltransferase [Paenibacillus sp. sptzw28]QYR21991.1 class I SAM-dependent methyltransferase [Paenibacillus sp. sptzw28]